jgi:hypothetical protein
MAIPRHILGMDKEIDKGLAAFVTTLQGPFGQIPFEPAVVRHLRPPPTNRQGACRFFLAFGNAA